MAFDFWEEERRRTLTPGEKKKLLKQAGGKCEYCGRDIVAHGERENIHHIKPFAKGGSDKADNLIVLCPNCHSKFDIIPAEELKKKIAYRVDKPAKRVDARKTASVAKTTGESSRRTATKTTSVTMKRHVSKTKSRTGKTTESASKSKITIPAKRAAKKTTAKAQRPSSVSKSKKK